MAVRRVRGLRLSGVMSWLMGLCFSASAFAQTPAAPVPGAPPAPASPPAVEPPASAPVERSAPVQPPAVVETPQAAKPETTPAPTLPELPAPAAVEAAPRSFEETAPATDEDWYDAFDVRLFADAYYSLNYNFPKPQAGSNDLIRAFDTNNGFALAWAGLDISHPADPVGGTLALRFGPSAKRYNSSCLTAKCDADYGLENVKQAFASWRPGGEGSPVSLDFGKFDTIYGAEVAESQDNINYTRGVLYWLGQPLFHTGLRVNVELGQHLSLRAIAANGWNNSVDNNAGKTFGLQATGHVPRGDGHDLFAASLGYLGGPEQDDYFVVQCPAGSQFDASSSSSCSTGSGAAAGTLNRSSSNSKGWRHFVDLVMTSDPIETLHLVLNADYGVQETRDTNLSSQFDAKQWWGVMLGARYLLSQAFALGARAEYYDDHDGLTLPFVYGDKAAQTNPIPIPGDSIYTGTLTIDYLPTKNLVLRLENRLDHSTKEIFAKGVRDSVAGAGNTDTFAGSLFTTTLGVVVTTN